MKIAIVGTGISGLTAAWMLNTCADITVYEKNPLIGGHARTLTIDYLGELVNVDTGFIVFNHRCYPLLTALFEYLGVETEKTDMSFSASIDKGWLEYGTYNLSSLFGQKRNLFRPAYLGMLSDIARFFKAAKYLIEMEDATETLRQFIERNNFGNWFRDYYLLAMGGAIWSAPLKQMLEFPALTFMRFFDNHGLLSPNGQLQWRTVKGGSKEYLAKLTESFKAQIRVGCEIVDIEANNGSVNVTDNRGLVEKFDHVIIAAHADETLAMLKNASENERRVLSAFSYQKNIAYLHRDDSFMPKRNACWSSWNYLGSRQGKEMQDVSLTYWMNKLQHIDKDYPLFVTLNPERELAADLTFDKHIFHHPVFTRKAIEAQKALPAIQGKRNIWFCGAYQRYGFHEDGMMSGVEVARQLGAELPWKA
jgi:predicted NAD/FAD-binding protein